MPILLYSYSTASHRNPAVVQCTRWLRPNRATGELVVITHIQVDIDVAAAITQVSMSFRSLGLRFLGWLWGVPTSFIDTWKMDLELDWPIHGPNGILLFASFRGIAMLDIAEKKTFLLHFSFCGGRLVLRFRTNSPCRVGLLESTRRVSNVCRKKK